MQQPLVSVIIPTYNRADKVVTAIESVQRQTYVNIQLIVVDDGSRDGTGERLRHLPGIEYIYQENGGQAAARNAGLAQAKGELIASLDSDDYWEPFFLERCVGALLTHDADFVFANWNQKSKRPTVEWEDFLSNFSYIQPFIVNGREGFVVIEPDDLRMLYIQACPSPSSSVVMKRSSIVGGWNRNMNIGDDWGLYLDMILTKPCRAAFTVERLWYKDIDGQNIFDGRERAEVVKLLLVDDTKEIISRYRDRMTVSELKILERQYVEGLMELGKHVLIREYKLAGAFRLFGEAVSTNFAHSMSTIIKLLKYAFYHRYYAFRRKIRPGLTTSF